MTAHRRPASIEQLQDQNTQDGFFHLAPWLVPLAGTAMLFHATRHARSAAKIRVLIGSMLTGWALGLFDLVEVIIDHQILGIHHVFPGHPLQFWSDMLFLVGGGVFAMIDGLLFRLSRN